MAGDGVASPTVAPQATWTSVAAKTQVLSRRLS